MPEVRSNRTYVDMRERYDVKVGAYWGNIWRLDNRGGTYGRAAIQDAAAGRSWLSCALDFPLRRISPFSIVVHTNIWLHVQLVLRTV